MTDHPKKNAAALAVKPGRLEYIDAPFPEPRDRDVLVHYEVASICGSDLHIVNLGWNVDTWPLPPGYPGHEGVGTVVDSRSDLLSPGDRVLAVPHIWNSFGFAQFQAVDDQHLLPLPSDGDAAELSLAQQLGTVIFAAKRLPKLDGETVVVLGQGSAGLFWDFVLKRQGAGRILAIEPITHRLNVGLMYGVDDTLDVIGNKAEDAVMDLTAGSGADIVIEAVGSTETLNQAFRLVREEGQIVLFGLPEKSGPVPFDYDTWFRKRASAYTRLGSQDEPGLSSYRKALSWIIDKQIDVKPIITHKISGNDVQRAFDIATNRIDGVIKVALSF